VKPDSLSEIVKWSFAGRTNRRAIIQRGKHGPTSSEKAVHLTTGDDLKPSGIKPIV
jgi:hypothetical protein